MHWIWPTACFLGGSTDSSNRDQLKHAHRQQQQQRRHSETKRISASNLDNYPSKKFSETNYSASYALHFQVQVRRQRNHLTTVIFPLKPPECEHLNDDHHHGKIMLVPNNPELRYE